MENMISENIKNEVETLDNIQNSIFNIKEDDIAKREKVLNERLEKIKSYGLEWTIRSIEFIVSRQGYTFNQLRSCVFINTLGETEFNIIKSVILIVEAGLIGSKQVDKNDTNKLEDRAYDIVEEWVNNYGYIGGLHILLINIMEKKHFFMDTQDMEMLELLSYKNLQTDLVTNHMMIDLENRINQAKAM